MGGGVMRTAASRLVGVGTAVGGVGSVIRGSQSVQKPEYQAPFTTGKRPASAIAASSSSVVAEREKTVSGLDDWEFAGVEIDETSSFPRVVFGGAPSFDEAKEATLELKEAVDKTLTESGNVAGMPLLMGSEKSESITFLSNSDVVSANTVPKYAMQAFRFLSENPAAQNVVASVASDPNVWNAVLQNTAFVDYLESHRADNDGNLNQNIRIEELQDMNCYAESESSSVGSSESTESGTSFAEIMKNIKLTVMDIVSQVSTFFQDVFGIPEADKKSTDDPSSGTSSFIESTTLKASVMGLVIMVISMVVLKRA